MHVSAATHRSQGVGSPRAGVAGDCELPHVGAGLETKLELNWGPQCF